MPVVRWTLLVAAALLIGMSGCRQAWVTTDPYPLGRRGLDPDEVPERLDKLTHPEAAPVTTVADSDRPRRPIALAECICLALENGRTGEFYDQVGSGRQTSVNGLVAQAQPSNFSDNIRVFAYDPAVVATEIHQALARFDAVWRTVAVWDHVDPVPGLDASSTPLFGILNGLTDSADVRSELLKPLPTGGVAGITVRTDYARSNYPLGSPIPNPAYLPGMDFTFEQPLLQGGGVLLNQIRESFPTALREPIPSSVAPLNQTPGILIARLNRDQTQLEFERRVHQLLFAVEAAYWDLYCAYWDLYTRDIGLRQAQLTWQAAKQRLDAGGATEDEVAQIEEQYHFFRTQRLEALGRGTPGLPGVLEAERHLRYLVGLPVEDGTRLVPTDTPVRAPVEPNWSETVRTAQERRPELLQIQKDIQVAQLALVRAKDFLLPDLRFFSKYGINSLEGSPAGGPRLNGEMFSSWETGLQLEVPIGFRAANAEVTRSRLLLAQRYAFLRDQESNLLSSLERSYRDVVQFREEMLTRRSQREATEIQLKVRYARFRAKGGAKDLAQDALANDLLLRTQRSWADALRDEYVAICRYNTALADLERQKGTIPEYHNVKLLEGDLPTFAQEHASAHVRAQNQPIVAHALELAGNTPPADPLEALTAPALLDSGPGRILTYLRPGDK